MLPKQLCKRSKNRIMETKKPERKPILLIVALLAFAVLMTVGFLIYQFRGSFGGDYNTTLSISAKGLNFACPKDLGNGVRLDSVAAKRELQFFYYYTLTTMDVNAQDTAGFCSAYEKGVTKNMYGNKDMSEFGKNNVTMIFSMRDKRGNLMCTVTLPPEKYYIPKSK